LSIAEFLSKRRMCYNGMDVVYKEGGGHTSAENMEVIMKSEQSE
jgi:hypothetical protein